MAITIPFCNVETVIRTRVNDCSCDSRVDSFLKDIHLQSGYSNELGRSEYAEDA